MPFLRSSEYPQPEHLLNKQMTAEFYPAVWRSGPSVQTHDFASPPHGRFAFFEFGVFCFDKLILYHFRDLINAISRNRAPCMKAASIRV
jgi:hypothetical protein